MLDRAYDLSPSTYRTLRWESQKSVTPLWVQGRRAAEGDIIFSFLLTSYDLFFLCPSIRYSVHTFIYFYLSIFPRVFVFLIALLPLQLPTKRLRQYNLKIYRNPVRSSIINTRLVKLSSIPAC
jgi:hypothetical protein